MLIKKRRLLLCAFLMPFFSAGLMRVQAEETSQSVESLLKDALLFVVDVSVNSINGEEELWSTQVNKITIPGREVKLEIGGKDARLLVTFTPYPDKSDTLLLAVRSETWISGDYSSSLTSLPIAYRDKVYYYPLGRAGEGAENNPVEVSMIINIVPYLDTLGRSERKALEEVFNSSSHFQLTEED